jgi:hypothetical protein
MSGNKMKGRLEMSEIGMAASEEVVLSVVTHLKNGRIEDALAGFAEEFRFKDHGIGLEFKEKEHLAEFLHKTRELYPESFLQTDTIFVSGDRAFLRRTHTKGPSLAAWGFHRADRRRQDYGLVRLLRRTGVPAHSLGVVFHGMG